jgi:hypothetical protein
MASRILALITGLALIGSAGAASACGQLSHVDPAKPGQVVLIRGYGYGFEGGQRPVTLVWAASRSIAGTATIDVAGNFEIAIPAPDAPGEHELVAMEGEGDPAPMSVTVTVLAIGA